MTPKTTVAPNPEIEKEVLPKPSPQPMRRFLPDPERVVLPNPKH